MANTFSPIGQLIQSPVTTMLTSTQSGIQDIYSGYLDDSSYSFVLPWAFPFYTVINTATWYVGSNSNITTNGDTGTGANGTADAGIFIGSADNASNYMGKLVNSDGKSVTIHFEGYNYYNQTTLDLVWDVTLFQDGVIQVVTDPTRFDLTSQNRANEIGEGNGSGTNNVTFNPVAGQTYVFYPSSDFTTYTVYTGYSYTTQVASPNPPDVPTNLSSSIGTTLVTFSGTVNDQDGGTVALSVEYSTDQTFSSGVSTVVSSYANVGSSASVNANLLNSNTVYYWRARSFDGMNYSGYSSVMSFTSPTLYPPTLSSISPASQTELSATAYTNLYATVTSPNNLNVQAVFDISQDSTFASGVTTRTTSLSASGTNMYITTPTLTNGVWYWRVKGVDSVGVSSSYSNTFVLYVDGQVYESIVADAIITETNYTGSLSAIQDTPSSPDGNWITSGTASGTLVVSFPTPSKILKTGVGVQQFNVSLRATNTSNVPTATLTLLENGTSLTSISSGISSTGGQTMSLTWDSNQLADKTGAGVQLKIDGSYVTSGSGKNATHTGVDIGSIQWYACEVFTPTHVADPTPIADTTPPAEVTNLSSSHTDTTVDLSWTNPTDSDFDHVNVYNSIGTMIGTSTNGTYHITGLTASTQYTYLVKTVDATGNISNGRTINVTTSSAPDTTAPSNVTNLAETHTYNTATLTWTNPSDSDFSKANVYRNNVLIGNSTNGTYADSGLSSSTVYTYKVTSVDSSNNESTGTTITVTTSSQPVQDTTPPAEVTSLRESHTDTGVTLQWTNPSDSDFDHANVYRDSSLIGNSQGGLYIDDYVSPSTTYTYKITTVDTTGNESTGSTISVTTNATQSQGNAVPIVPVNLFPFNNSAWTKLHFEADVTDADSTSLTFYVDYSTNSTLSSGVTTLSTPVTLPSVGSTARASITSANAVTESTVYYWRAYVKDESGNQSAYTPIFKFTIKNASGDNMVADGTPFMQQGDYTNFINFIDVSDYQGTIDWAGVKSSGINYAILCTRHALADDTLFTTYVSQAKAQGIKTGGYFFPNPAYPLDLADARTQADHFASLLQAGYGTGQYGDLIPMLDLEDNSSRVSGSQSYNILSLTVDQMLQWCNEFRNHFESTTGRTLGLYTTEYFVRNTRNNFNYDYTTGGAVAGTSGNLLLDMPLWISGFTGYPRYMGGVMPSAGGWTKWQAFQHGDTSYGEFTVTGVTGTCDLDWALPEIEWLQPPSTVTGLSSSQSGSDINLTWTPSTEVDVHKWDIYVDGVKVGTSTVNGSYTISNAQTGTHTIEVRPIDDFGDDPTTSPTTISYTITANPPNVNIIDVTHYTISDETGFTSTDITFTFDEDVTDWTVNVNGVSWDSGTVADSGSSGGSATPPTTVATASTWTVSIMATKTVSDLANGGTSNIITAGTQLKATIDWTELYSEGQNRVNIYGKNASGQWTPYES